jgi:hypothetical protein
MISLCTLGFLFATPAASFTIHSQHAKTWPNAAVRPNAVSGPPADDDTISEGIRRAMVADEEDTPRVVPLVRNLVRNSGGDTVPADYAAKQLTLNRVRDCAMTNKDDLMSIMRSPDLFTRSGKSRMDQVGRSSIVGWLIVYLAGH